MARRSQKSRTIWSIVASSVLLGALAADLASHAYRVSGQNPRPYRQESFVRSAVAVIQPRTPHSPVRHIIIICQENHSFDNYFGTYPWASGFIPLPGTPRVESLPAGAMNRDLHGRPVHPFTITTPVTPDLPHGYADMRAETDGGKMDGYVRVNEKEAQRAQRGSLRGHHKASAAWITLPMGHYDYRIIGPYWDYAQHFTIADHWFPPVMGPTTTNVLYMVAARAGDWHGLVTYTRTPPKQGLYTFPNIGDELTKYHVSWAWYQGGNPSKSMDDPFPFFRNYNLGAYRGHLKPLSQFQADLRSGRVADVVFLKPDGQDEHPGTNVSAGVKFVVTTIDAIMRSPIWQSSVVILTYDESGGWYDHVSPPDMNRYSVDGLQADGPRVPTLIISPFAKENAVSHTIYDTTSILRFIEWNWQLPPLNRRDAAAANLIDMLNFTHPDYAPFLLPTPGQTAASAPPRGNTGATVLWNNFPLASTGAYGPFWHRGYVYAALPDICRNLNASLYPAPGGETMAWMDERYTFLPSANELLVDGEPVKLSAPMLEMHNVLYVPVATVAKAMGFQVSSVHNGLQVWVRGVHEVV
jgi:phospholipase C